MNCFYSWVFLVEHLHADMHENLSISGNIITDFISHSLRYMYPGVGDHQEYHSEKKWSQTGTSEEPFWKMTPLCKEGPFFPKEEPK